MARRLARAETDIEPRDSAPTKPKLRVIPGGQGQDLPANVKLEQKSDRIVKRRTWLHNNVRMPVPEGWNTTLETARKLGLKNCSAVNNKSKTGKIAGRKFAGITIISDEEIGRFRVEMERLMPPEGCVRIGKKLKEVGITESVFNRSVQKSETEEKYFVINNLHGEEKRFRVYTDIDRYNWMTKADLNTVISIVKLKKKEQITIRDVAEILEIKIGHLVHILDHKNKCLNYMLSNCEILPIKYAMDKDRKRFSRTEVREAREFEDSIKERMRPLRMEIKALGFSNAVNLREWIEDAAYAFEFTLNGRKHKIEVKKGKDHGLFVWDNEFDTLVRWRNIVRLKSHCRLMGTQISRAVIVQRNLLNRYNPSTKEIVLFQENNFKIAVPVEEADGKLYVKKKVVPLLRFFLDMSKRYSEIRQKTFEEFTKSNLSEPDFIQHAKPLLLKNRFKNEKNLILRASIREFLERQEIKKSIDREIPGIKEVAYRRIKFDPLLAGRKKMQLLAKIKNAKSMEWLLALAKDYGVVIPISGNNGNSTIDERDVPLLDLYLRLYHPVNGESIPTALSFLRKVLQSDEVSPSDAVALWIVRQFALDKFSEAEIVNKGVGKLIYKHLSDEKLIDFWYKGHPREGRNAFEQHSKRIPRGMLGRSEEIEIMIRNGWEDKLSELRWITERGDLSFVAARKKYKKEKADEEEREAEELDKSEEP